MAGVSWTVRKTIFVAGHVRRISVAAAIPFIPAMLMSRAVSMAQVKTRSAMSAIATVVTEPE